jgi:hypothetical protein
LRSFFIAHIFMDPPHNLQLLILGLTRFIDMIVYLLQSRDVLPEYMWWYRVLPSAVDISEIVCTWRYICTWLTIWPSLFENSLILFLMALNAHHICVVSYIHDEGLFQCWHLFSSSMFKLSITTLPLSVEVQYLLCLQISSSVILLDAVLIYMKCVVIYLYHYLSLNDVEIVLLAWSPVYQLMRWMVHCHIWMALSHHICHILAVTCFRHECI